MKRRFIIILAVIFLNSAWLGGGGCAPYAAPTQTEEAQTIPTPESAAPGQDQHPPGDTGLAAGTQPDEIAAPPQPLSHNEYEVRLEYDPVERVITGVEKITFANRTGAALNQVYVMNYFNAFAEDYTPAPYFEEMEDKLFARGVDYGYCNILNASINSDEAEITTDGVAVELSAQNPVAEGEQCVVLLQFEAYIPELNARTGGNGQETWFGNFLPILAAHDSEGWHKDPYYPAGDPFYSEISNYTVSVSAPANYTVAGTGPLTVTEMDNKRTTTFNARLVRDFAFAIGSRYTLTTAVTQHGTEVQLYSFSPEINRESLLTTAIKSLEYYNTVIGSYPYEELKIVEAGLYTNGMEYPGIIFMDSDYLKRTSDFRSVAHEIGHQWFYNVVGNNQTRDAWLDEGLTMLIQEGVFYDRNGIDLRMREDYEILASKRVSAGKSMDDPLGEFGSWSEYYDTHYTKGKLMAYALMLKMGDEKFYEFIKRFYSEYSFKIADKEAFIETAEAVYGEKLTSFFDAWFGLPLPPLEDTAGGR
ncbi:MAG: M1 family metallopeptidase [Clostridiales bacterium]|jgi:hypothetical protein|nr:M1 family metallopeptidase [Clostridiales bacterium]